MIVAKILVAVCIQQIFMAKMSHAQPAATMTAKAGYHAKQGMQHDH